MVVERPQQPGRSAAAFPTVAAALAALVSSLALFGWAADLGALKAVLPGGVAMNPATAVAATFVALALALQREGAPPRARLFGRLVALCVIALSLLILARYALGWDAGIDAALFRDRLDGNRMAPTPRSSCSSWVR